MVEIVWTSRFVSDLQELKFYLDKNSPSEFAKLSVKIERKLKLLSSYPEIGRVLFGRDERRIRQLIVDRYQIIYEIASSSIILLTLHHSAREKLHEE